MNENAVSTMETQIKTAWGLCISYIEGMNNLQHLMRLCPNEREQYRKEFWADSVKAYHAFRRVLVYVWGLILNQICSCIRTDWNSDIIFRLRKFLFYPSCYVLFPLVPFQYNLEEGDLSLTERLDARFKRAKKI